MQLHCGHRNRVANMRNQQTVKKTLAALFLIIVAAVCAGTANADVTRIYGEELQKMLDQGVPIIDVRRRDEWRASGVIEYSHLLTFFDEMGRYDIEKWLSELHKIVKKGEPFILICEAGIRTGSIASFLDGKLNYTNVYDVAGGIRMWIDDGGNVVPAPEKDQ